MERRAWLRVRAALAHPGGWRDGVFHADTGASQGGARRAGAKAARGKGHAITGRVVHGRGEGTGFGIATANLDLSATMVVQPKDGVYGGYAIVDGAPYAAAINMGVAKSFEGQAPRSRRTCSISGETSTARALR